MKFPVRFLSLLSALVMIFCGLSYRIVCVASRDREYYRKFINSARASHEVKRSIRGQIRDRNGAIFAMTTQKIDLGVDPYATRDSDREKIPQLATLLQIPQDNIWKFFYKETYIKGGKKRQVRWKKIATLHRSDVYDEILKLKIKGVYGSFRNDRVYPNHTLASHIIGFLNKEGVAVSGVERFMDKFLCGQDGWIDSEKDGQRRELMLFRETTVEPHHGAHIELTISLGMQDSVEKILSDAVKKNNAKSGTAIVSDPTTGEILALCNVPTFDCNSYNKSDVDSLRNRAITDTYEPGSVFKIIPFSIALQQEIIALDEYFDCSGGIFFFGGKGYALPKDHMFLGRLSATDVLRKSSNRGIAQIGIRLGANRLYNAAKAFGFGTRTGYGFDGEASGILHPPKRWDGLTITRLPMGHAISVTPLQMHQAVGVIASGGYLLEPKVIRRVIDTDGTDILFSESHIVRRVLTTKIAQQLRDILYHPDSKPSKVSSVKLAYKTGTSQKIINGKYSQQHHISSCSGFFPADSPRYLVTVVIDDAIVNQGMATAYGSKVAFPVFSDIVQHILSREILDF